MSAAFETLDSGERVEYESGMRRDVDDGKPRYDLIPTMPLRRLADLYTRGAVKYGDNNWQLANSDEEMTRFRASAMRHLEQWRNGDTDEDHAIATVWNIFAYLFVEEKLAAAAAQAALPVNPKCACGHLRSAHIYYEGPCRPGFACKSECKEVTPARDREALVEAFHESMKSGEPVKILDDAHPTRFEVNEGRFERWASAQRPSGGN